MLWCLDYKFYDETYSLTGLDHSDGDKFNEILKDLELEDYYEYSYFQSLWWFFLDGYLDLFKCNEVFRALELWINRSIK